MARRFYNNVSGTGTLTISAGAGDTSLTTTGFTSTPTVPFTAVIDRGMAAEECILVTAVAGGVITVQRGYDSTSASSHSSGATVEHAIIAEGPNKWDAHVEATTGIHGLTGAFVGTTDAQTVTSKTNQASVYEAQNTTSPGTGALHKATVDNTARAGFSADTTGTAAAGKAFQVTQSGSDKFLVSADGSVVVSPSGSPTWAEDITGNLRVTGNETITGTLTTGAVTGTSATLSGALAAASSGITGNETVGGTLGVTGAATLSGNATVGGTLGITGATTAAAITASGNVSAGSITSTVMRHKGIFVGGATSVTTTNTSYVSLGSDDVSLTFTYPPSGIVTVHLRGFIANSEIVADRFGSMGFEIRDTNSVGTIRLAASDDNALSAMSTIANHGPSVDGIAVLCTGLPTSGTGFIRAMYKSQINSNTASFFFRGITVIPSP